MIHIYDDVKLQNKVIRIMNDVSIRNHISPHYSHLNILKFPDIVKLYACLFLYDHLCDAKSSNFRCTSIIRAIQLYYRKIHRLTSEFHVNSSEKLRKQTGMADMGTSREISTNVLPWEERKIIEVLVPKRPCSKGKSADFVNGNASFQVPRNVQLRKQTDIVGA